MGFFDKSKLKGLKAKEEKGNKPKVMIVDDESGNLLALSAMLEDEYEILQASDGKEAFEMIQEMDKPESICLIISDQRMPRMSGTELFQRLIPIIPNTVRILLTAYTDVRSIMDSINEAKIYKFMVKPFDPDELLITIRRAVESYEQGRALVKSQNAIEEQVAIRTKDLELKNQELIIQNQQLQQNICGSSGKGVVGSIPGTLSREFLQSLIEADLMVANRLRSNTSGVALDLLFYFIEIDGVQGIASEYGNPSIILLHSQMADLLRQSIDSSDFVIEWSDSIFVVASRFKNKSEAGELADKLTGIVRAREFDLDGGQQLSITCSVSMVACPLYELGANGDGDVISWAQVLDCGEHALGVIQRAGGNCWVTIVGNDEIPQSQISQYVTDDLSSAFENKTLLLHCSNSDLNFNWKS